jgi:hypothetical protein
VRGACRASSQVGLYVIVSQSGIVRAYSHKMSTTMLVECLCLTISYSACRRKSGLSTM